MSDVIREALKTFAKDKSTVTSSGVEAFTPPTLKEMARMPIVAVDQSLSNTGYVAFEVNPIGKDSLPEVTIHAKGNIKPVTEKTSFWGNYEKANILAEEFHKLLWYLPCSLVVIEMPAVYGRRTESSLLAGAMIMREADRHKKDTMIVSAQHARSVIGGKDCKEKKDVRNALKPYIQGISTRAWNEATRDALIIGLTAAVEKKTKGYV